MKLLKRYYFFFLVLASVAILFQHTGCVKEYSFEGAPVDSIPTYDTIPIEDTIPVDTITSPPAITLPPCSSCNAADEIVTGQWGFTTGDSYACGSYTNSGFIGGDGHMSFTFFGPSACSGDTGIVVSAYLPVALDRDRFNITANSAAFYYYDHNASNDILLSRLEAPFSLTVQSFIYATGIVTGVYSGPAFTVEGDTAYITNGRFKAPLY